MNRSRLFAFGSVVGALTVAAAPALATTGTVTGAIASNFNGTSIAAGDWVWFNANFKYTGPTNQLVIIAMENVAIQFSNGTSYNLAVPDSRIRMDPAATVESYDFDEALNTWVITVPASFSSDIFLSGLAWQVPAGGLPGGTNPVTWSADFSSTVSPVTVKWKWGAAVYTDFTADYDLLGVEIAHHSDQPGTPQNYTCCVTGGARGGGGSNYTGSWSGTKSVDLSQPVSVEDASWGGIKALYR